MGAVQAFLIFSLVSLPLGLLVYALFDSGKYEEATWEAAGQNKMFWTVAILLIGCLGPILYLLVTRPKLRRIEPDAAATDLDPGVDRFS